MLLEKKQERGTGLQEWGREGMCVSLKSEKSSLKRRHLSKDLWEVRVCHVAVEGGKEL